MPTNSTLLSRECVKSVPESMLSALTRNVKKTWALSLRSSCLERLEASSVVKYLKGSQTPKKGSWGVLPSGDTI